MIGKRHDQVFCDHLGEAAVAEFIRTKGVTRCPTACVVPTQGSVAAADRAALEAYAEGRDRVRRARVMARRHSLFSMELVAPPPD